jgi:hypothetical protein
MAGFNRRGFLALLGSVAATAALDPERALWIHGAKLISIPMPVVARPADAADIRLAWSQDWELLTLQNELMLAKAKRAYGDSWFSRAPKIGDTLFLHKPPRFGIAGIATNWL